MNTPNSVLAVAGLAQSLRISGPQGEYEVVRTPKAGSEIDGIHHATMQRHLAEMTANISNVMSIASNMMAQIQTLDSHFKLAVELYEKTAQLNRDLESRMSELAAVLHQPVVPVYNREGKLIAAKRVAKKA